MKLLTKDYYIMTFQPNFSKKLFRKISLDKFIAKYHKANPNSDLSRLKNDLIYFQKLKGTGENCKCGNVIWIIGSAISGKGCFTCISGETDQTKDYEIA